MYFQHDQISCCGVNELWGFEDNEDLSPKEQLLVALNNSDVPYEAYAFFTAAERGGTTRMQTPKVQYGQRFKSFIESEGLGTVTRIGPNRNRNSGNMLWFYVWKINHAALRKWYAANREHKSTWGDNW